MDETPTAEHEATGYADERAAGAGKTVLVVNRDPDLLRLVRRTVEAESYRALGRRYQVVVCRGPARAYAAVEAARPDVIVLDAPPGDEESWHALDRIKGDPRTAAIPLIVCSDPVPEVLAREASLRQRGCDLLLKPFSVDELLERVRRLAGEARPLLRPPADRVDGVDQDLG